MTISPSLPTITCVTSLSEPYHCSSLQPLLHLLSPTVLSNLLLQVAQALVSNTGLTDALAKNAELRQAVCSTPQVGRARHSDKNNGRTVSAHATPVRWDAVLDYPTFTCGALSVINSRSACRWTYCMCQWQLQHFRTL